MSFDGGSIPLLDVWRDTGVDNTTSVGTATNGEIAGSTADSGFSSNGWDPVTNPLLAVTATAGGAFAYGIPTISLDITGAIDGERALTLDALDSTGESEAGGLAEGGPWVWEGLDVTGSGVCGAIADGAPQITLSVEGFTGNTCDITLDAITLDATLAVGAVAAGAPTIDALVIAGSLTSAANSLSGSPALDSIGLDGAVLAGTASTFEALLPDLVLEAGIVVGGIGTATLTIPVVDLSGDAYTATVIGSGVIELALVVAGQVDTTGDTTSQGDASASAALVAGSVSLSNQAMCLNTSTIGLTLYDNFPFNSMAKFKGQYVGITSDGIYALDGNDDNGTPIQAVLTTGLQDGKILTSKRIRQAFIGYSANGPLELRVKTDDADWNSYVLEETKASGTYRNRVKLGRGAKGNYFQFELRNLNGCQFSIDNIDFPIEPLTRRTS